MSGNECPKTEMLHGLLAGTLSSTAADLVSQHLDTCSQCCEVLASLPDSQDDLVGRLRHAEIPGNSFTGKQTHTRQHTDTRDHSTGLPPEVDQGEFEVLGDYRLIRQIGAGGMGVVYEAEQRALGRRVAVKILSRDILKQEDAIQRFQREAESAASLHHTNIIPVFEVGCADGTWFYAMQLIDGHGLDVVRREVQSIRSRIARSTAAVAVAETRKKQHNIGVARILDKLEAAVNVGLL